MDLDKKAVQEVVDLFDIKYVQDDEESSSTVGMSSNFADLEGEVSSIISNLEDKGEALEAPEKVVEATEEVVTEELIEDKETEEELETIEDLIATSVEEAKVMTATQEVQAEEQKKIEAVEEAEMDAQLQDDCDSIEVTVMQADVVNANDNVVTVEAMEDIEIGEAVVINHAAENEVETSPAVLEDEDIDIIPCKDSEGNIKGEIKMKDVRSISWDKKGEPIISGGEILWNTDSPTELYDEFYNIKQKQIDTFSCGKQLDFEKLYADLCACSVDISTEILDKDILMKHMDIVVQGINRVAMIQVQVNQQQFVWKRFVELLRGALARVQYLKPVLKQEGLILEHMGDIEFYVERLTALKDSAHKIMQSLERAFEAVSRKVSVMLTVQSKHTDRTSPDAYSNTHSAPPVYETTQEVVQPVPVPAPANSELDDYDGFDVGAVVAPVKPKAGVCNWGDIC